MLYKKGLALCALFSSMALQAEQKAVANKIMFVNVTNLLNIRNPQAGLMEFSDKVTKLQEEMQKKQTDLMKLEQDFRKALESLENMRKSGVASADTIKKKEDELVKKQQEGAQMNQSLQEYSQRATMALEEDFNSKIEAAADKLKKQDGWDSVILNYGGLKIVTDKQFDYTDKIKADLDADYAKKKSEDAKKAAKK